MSEQKQIRDERIHILFDCICGVISSSIAIGCLIFTAINRRIFDHIIFMVSMVFWISWLSLSGFLIVLGIYTMYKSKHFDEKKQRRDLRPPII